MEKRALTEQELAILNRLLSIDFPGRDELTTQLKACMAKPTADNDNYGSVYLICESSQPAVVDSRVPVEGRVLDADKEEIDILLHVVDGFMSELEIVKLNGTPLLGDIDPSNIIVSVNTA